MWCSAVSTLMPPARTCSNTLRSSWDVMALSTGLLDAFGDTLYHAVVAAGRQLAPSSSGLGHSPFTANTKQKPWKIQGFFISYHTCRHSSPCRAGVVGCRKLLVPV